MGHYGAAGTSNNLGYIYNHTGQYTTLNVPGSQQGSNPAIQGTWPGGINDAGDVAGYYFDLSGQSHGFVLDGVNCTTLDVILPSAVSGTTRAFDIDNAGVVVGEFDDFTGTTTVIDGFIATPVPEPGSLALLALGGAMVTGNARYRARKKPRSANPVRCLR